MMMSRVASHGTRQPTDILSELTDVGKHRNTLLHLIRSKILMNLVSYSSLFRVGKRYVRLERQVIFSMEFCDTTI